jgi:hypothetical protein
VFLTAPEDGVDEGAEDDPDTVAAWNRPPCTVAGDELDEAPFAADVKAVIDSFAL